MERYINLFKSLALLNYDNGKMFVKRDRLDAIHSILKITNYKKVNTTGLFDLYALNGELPEDAVLISTHVDCESSITECFADEYQEDYLIGTFDNLITNALAVHLMVEHQLNNNVIVAFTGDEEENSQGAYGVVRFLEAQGCLFKTVVLDVTYMGWEEEALFTVENNFWGHSLGRKVIGLAKKAQASWQFVPSDENDIPCYVPDDAAVEIEALEDETWAYDEEHIECFSLCIPVDGEMHSDRGVIVRRASVLKYAEMLKAVANTI